MIGNDWEEILKEEFKKEYFVNLMHHIREEYQISTDQHVVHPFLHEKLEQKQQQSAFWRNPVVAWIWIHIPDILGMIFLLVFIFAIYMGGSLLWQWLKANGVL